MGLHYNFDAVRVNDTELAHQIMQYAKKFQKEHALINRYYKAYFEEGMDIGDQKALLQVADDLGLDLVELNREIESGLLKAEIEKDEGTARRYGIDTIPHFIFDGKYALTGAQDEEIFLKALNKVR